MKDQIDVAIRRSPKYSVFMGIGAALGVIIAGILAMFVDPADMPMGYTVAKGLGLLLLVLGAGGLFLGGLVALILDWTGRKRAKEFRVGAQIDMVDDPKEVARRRIAEARGEDPDAGAAGEDDPADVPADGADAREGGAASADGSADGSVNHPADVPADGADVDGATDDPAASASESANADDTVVNRDSTRGSTPDSTV